MFDQFHLKCTYQNPPWNVLLDKGRIKTFVPFCKLEPLRRLDRTDLIGPLHAVTLLDVDDLDVK